MVVIDNRYAGKATEGRAVAGELLESITVVLRYMARVFEVPTRVEGRTDGIKAADDHRSLAQTRTLEADGCKIANRESFRRPEARCVELVILPCGQLVAVVFYQHPHFAIPVQQRCVDRVSGRIGRPVDGIGAGIDGVVLTVV